MKKPKIYSFIKTPCGRAKFQELSSQTSLVSKIRLGWFILIATIKDWGMQEID